MQSNAGSFSHQTFCFGNGSICDLRSVGVAERFPTFFGVKMEDRRKPIQKAGTPLNSLNSLNCRVETARAMILMAE